VYEDIKSRLTALLIHAGYLDEDTWAGATPRYFIEVKATTGAFNDRFFMNGKQYRMVS